MKTESSRRARHASKLWCLPTELTKTSQGKLARQLQKFPRSLRNRTVFSRTNRRPNLCCFSILENYSRNKVKTLKTTNMAIPTVKRRTKKRQSIPSLRKLPSESTVSSCVNCILSVQLIIHFARLFLSHITWHDTCKQHVRDFGVKCFRNMQTKCAYKKCSLLVLTA